MYVFASATGGPARVQVFLDRRARHPGRVGVLHGRRGLLGPLRLDTTKLAEGSHTLSVYTGSGRSLRLVARAVFRVSNHGPPSSALIAAALATHRIDLGTSLLYRMYALWGDRRLPPAFRGRQTGGDDGVGLEAALAIQNHQVSAREQRLLRPFLVRPTDPASAFYVKPPARASRATAARRHGCNISALPSEAYPYIGIRGYGVIAWSNQFDRNYASQNADILSAASVFRAEQSDMGAPSPDAPYSCAKGNPDASLDIYVLPLGESADDCPARPPGRSSWRSRSPRARAGSARPS